MSELDYLNNTRRIRSMPKHLILTMFLIEEFKDIRKKDFSFISHKFFELKSKGNRLYKKKKYVEALNTYIEVFIDFFYEQNISFFIFIYNFHKI